LEFGIGIELSDHRMVWFEITEKAHDW